MVRPNLNPPALPKFGENTTAGPLVTFVRSESLRSFKKKRQEMQFVDTMAVVRQQRRAIQLKLEEEKRKEHERKRKLEMIKGDEKHIIKEELEDDDLDETN